MADPQDEASHPADAHGGPVRLTGMVAAVRLPPHGQALRFEVDLVTRAPKPDRISTGGEWIRLIWIGQRRVPGITGGRWLSIEGFLAEHQGLPTVYNPRYELLSGDPHEHRTRAR